MLTSFWFESKGGIGYGVTAQDRSDAEALLREFGYQIPGHVITRVVVGVQHAQLDQCHVVPNAGPMAVRGVWPRHNV